MNDNKDNVQIEDNESIFANLDEDIDQDGNGNTEQDHNGMENGDGQDKMQDVSESKVRDKRKFNKKMSLQDLCSKVRELDFTTIDISTLPYANESKNNITIKINNSYISFCRPYNKQD